MQHLAHVLQFPIVVCTLAGTTARGPRMAVRAEYDWRASVRDVDAIELTEARA